MFRKRIKHVANTKFSGRGSFENEMLLTVYDRIGVGELREFSARLRVLRGDRFVAEIEAYAIYAGLADNTCQNGGCDLKIEIGIFFRVTNIIENGSAWTAFNAFPLRMDWERRSPAHQNSFDIDPFVSQIGHKAIHF